MLRTETNNGSHPSPAALGSNQPSGHVDAQKTSPDTFLPSPEAAEGGPLAIVCDGDPITIDIPQRQLQLHLPEDEIQLRLSKWQRPSLRFTDGYLALYARLAESADQGAIIRHRM